MERPNKDKTMQSKSRPLDDITNLMTNAVGAMKGVGDEVKAMGRSQAEKIVADLDLVGRDEFEVLKSQLFKSQEETAKLSKEVKSLKAALKKATAK
jgi:BMFP domain-containing protein YqiC